MSSGNGYILSDYGICVDYWLNTPGKKYLHFLTHLHADHTVGLSSTFRDKIFTSDINKLLLTRWFKIDPNQIITTHLGKNMILPIDDGTTIQLLSVTFIDANHCPGSVMFLFQGMFGNILYTGDFRYTPDMLTNPMLKSVVQTGTLHQLYLDNTFAADHCEFPPKEELIESILDVIRSHPDHYIIIGMRKLGKEEIIREIGLQLKEKVCVSQEKLQLLTILQFEDIFTTNHDESRIFAVSISQIERYKTNLQEQKGPVIIIILSAFFHQARKSLKFNDNREVYFFPYSDHSSHSELESFVSEVNPHHIHPIVSSSSIRKMTEALSSSIRYLIKTNPEPALCNSVIPQSILKHCKYSLNPPTLKLTPNLFQTCLQQQNSLDVIEEGLKLGLNVHNTNGSNSPLNLSADASNSNNKIMINSKEWLNPKNSSIISNDTPTMANQSDLVLGCLMDISSTSMNNVSPNTKESEPFDTVESDNDFYPLSQEDSKLQKIAEDCKSLKKGPSNKSFTSEICNKTSHLQIGNITDSLIEGKIIRPSENQAVCYKERKDCSSNNLSLTLSDISFDKINPFSAPFKHLEISRQNMDVDFESIKLHTTSHLNGTLKEDSGADSDGSFFNFKSIDRSVATGHVSNTYYDKVNFSFQCISRISFVKKIDGEFIDNFHHSFKVWNDSISRNCLTNTK